MNSNSAEVFRAIAQDGTLTRMRKYILAVIVKHPESTDKEIAMYAGLPINRVTGRRGELVKMGRVELSGYDCYESNGRRIRASRWSAVGV